MLYNKLCVKHFRQDGHNWVKRKNGISVKESHEKLRINGEYVLTCCYTRGEDHPGFQRRLYWLLDSSSTTVLVRTRSSPFTCHRFFSFCEIHYTSSSGALLGHQRGESPSFYAACVPAAAKYAATAAEREHSECSAARCAVACPKCERDSPALRRL